MEKKSTIVLDELTFERLQNKITEMVEAQPEECHDLIELLDVLQTLKYKSVSDFFSSLPKYVEQIGARLEKSLYPMEIHDETSLMIGDTFRGFAKSLIHVIRNSVDHGIESAEERVEQGKEEQGKILLSITHTEETIIIEVADDGRGIDREKLKQKALAGGFRTPAELEDDEAVIELLFEDYLSTKEEVNDLSGRGVGLASVRSEVLKLGGKCRVVSEPGEGSRFIFFIPKQSVLKEV